MVDRSSTKVVTQPCPNAANLTRLSAKKLYDENARILSKLEGHEKSVTQNGIHQEISIASYPHLSISARYSRMDPIHSFSGEYIHPEFRKQRKEEGGGRG